MRLDPLPLFRRTITPWYDSDAACYLSTAIMVVVVCFGIQGISVALGNPEYRPHMWMPMTVTLLSAAVFLSITYRVVRRRLHERYDRSKVGEEE
jgi:uncharacterized membrane protein YhaH (DUF805 family)